MRSVLERETPVFDAVDTPNAGKSIGEFSLGRISKGMRDEADGVQVKSFEIWVPTNERTQFTGKRLETRHPRLEELQVSVYGLLALRVTSVTCITPNNLSEIEICRYNLEVDNVVTCIKLVLCPLARILHHRRRHFRIIWNADSVANDGGAKGFGNHRRACEKKHLLALQQKEYEKKRDASKSNPTRKFHFISCCL